MPSHYFCYISNMVFVKGVKCPSFHTQFLDYSEYRALQFYIVLRVNAFDRWMDRYIDGYIDT